MKLKKLCYLVLSAGFFNVAYSQAIFQIIPRSYLNIDPPGTTIGLCYAITNQSNIVQSNLKFTYPGAALPGDNGQGDDHCTNFKNCLGATLFPGDTCNLIFSFSVPTTGGRPIEIGKRNTPYEIGVCGYGGVGDDCSVADQSEGIDMVYNDANLIIIGGERSLDCIGDNCDPSMISRGTDTKDATLLPLPPGIKNGYISELMKVGYEKSIYGLGMSYRESSNFDLDLPYLIKSTDDGESWTVQNDLPLTHGFNEAHLYEGASNDALLQTDIAGIQWASQNGSVESYNPLILEKSSNQWQAIKPMLLSGFDEGSIYSIDYTDNHWIAVGKQFHSTGPADTKPYLLSSLDGKMWTPVNIPGLNEHAILKSVKLGNANWIAAGYTYTVSNDEDSQYPFFLMSHDQGVTWNKVILDSINRGEINYISYDKGVWIAVGYQMSAINHQEIPLILRSDDEGKIWVQEFAQDLPGYTGGLLYKVKKVGHYWIATGFQGLGSKDYEHLPLLEISVDNGIHWFPSTNPLTAGETYGSELTLIEG